MLTDFAMYTEEGNQGVAKIANQAKKQNWSWDKTYQALSDLAESDEVYAEAMDTAVREVVYSFIGAGTRNESFYI